MRDEASLSIQIEATWRPGGRMMRAGLMLSPAVSVATSERTTCGPNGSRTARSPAVSVAPRLSGPANVVRSVRARWPRWAPRPGRPRARLRMISKRAGQSGSYGTTTMRMRRVLSIQDSRGTGGPGGRVAQRVSRPIKGECGAQIGLLSRPAGHPAGEQACDRPPGTFIGPFTRCAGRRASIARSGIPEPSRTSRAGQSSSARKMPVLVQPLQMLVARSRSPIGRGWSSPSYRHSAV